MKTLSAKVYNMMMFSLMLPFCSGCQSGGGGDLGSLLGGGGDSLASVTGSGGADGLATVHNPEPATLILLGTGVATIAYWRRSSR